MHTHSEAVLDLDELRHLTMNDRQLMADMLGALIEDARRQVKMFSAAVAENDSVRSARIARNAGRACANVGANAAADTFMQLGRHAASREFAQCRMMMSAADEAIERLREEASRL